MEKIVLSFGINSRENRSRETTLKNAQAALGVARSRFPGSEVFIPQVNFSRGLPLGDQRNLRILNEELEARFPFIPLLPEDLFRTTSDHVHWTEGTARAIFSHWLEALNIRSP